MLADPNEVHAWVRITQDAAGLDELIAKTEEKIARMQTPKVSPGDARRGLVAPEPTEFVHEQQHTMGGALQPVMTGPSPSTIYSTSTREQAMINSALLEEQIDEGRHTAQKPAAVNITGGGTENEGYLPSEEAAAKAAQEGKDPLHAAAAARAGTAGGGMGVLPAVTPGEAASAGEGKGGPKAGTHPTHQDKEANPGRSAKK
jgi:hypothetical protein